MEEGQRGGVGLIDFQLHIKKIKDAVDVKGDTQGHEVNKGALVLCWPDMPGNRKRSRWRRSREEWLD